ncbi:unnamed protein product [Acanthoscelides obtectus]|uniref:Helicase SKI2W n=1 Tax=Acanthoscelides obtectus TaxID=200917 RepID=A0A9P0KSH2_ACAOB|nr:unnamed protein product [Acanthoscelides obtectus]CAK1682060.1 Helicase SKI2W [Acanthoscelides obtectus]
MDSQPIFLDVEEELKKYLLCPENLPVHQYEKNQEFWPRKPNPIELLHYENSPLCTTLKVHRNPNTGEIMGFREVPVSSAGTTAKNSMSLNRDPAPQNEATRGNASFVPFWPGSFPLPEQKGASKENELKNDDLLTVPPGFDRGLTFAEDGRTLLNETNQNKPTISSDSPNVINILEIVQQEQDILGTFAVKHEDEKEKTTAIHNSIIPEEEEILKEVPVLNISTVQPHHQSSLKGSEWAVLLDTTKPVTDFEERIPNMAIRFPFELDIFQKLAILQLEQHNHVFVAAHTSAGKTVVAEYAIALSQKHMTRTIYTSPIKALSNQKYRDFKATFKDVGLITGDFQINQTASCLIMTTEILRSMLYCGSDITRDLEYVIFDEVHYINDRERGHVWEQVLIMLPAHVCVILLSATVPNTIEFADWLGRTHQRKVYVVTTYKRPVPLQHYLYTGKGGSSRDNRFKILDADKWLMSAYLKAKESVADKETSNVYQKMTPAQDKTLWTGLVSHLKKHDLLPVVAFTFSRQKCDNNGANLTNLDLTTQKEKSHISLFFNKCIRYLKEPDRNIPQIVTMRDILTRGIGVHHSGILPIIKEIVEMLFQKGLIKLLFATETFAMGVNMPARTVIFDSIRKHDGKELRDLEPAEYIQMAGRAGRRGLDKEGTVIILCKLGMIPHEDNLKKMMLGKPSSLVSQFRLTYGMVLSLLRVESLSVEGMMLRSFREADHQKGMGDIKKELETVNQQLEEISRQQISSYLQPLVKFYESASSYLQARQDIMNTVFASPKVQKVLTPGRILVVTHKGHINKLALLLSQARSKQLQYKVLVLNDPSTCTDKTPNEDLFYYMLGLAQEKVFQPLGTPGHEILTVTPGSQLRMRGTVSGNISIVEACGKKSTH